MSFPATHVSIIQRARNADPAIREPALDALARVYWKPIYLHIRLAHQQSASDAEDLTQGFFAEAMRRELFGRFDPARARFRTYVRTCVDTFVANEQKAKRRIKRGGDFRFSHVPIDDIEQTLAYDWNPERAFHDAWVHEVFSTALEQMRRAYAQTDKTRQFMAFERYDVFGSAGEVRPTYAALAMEIGVPVTQLTNWLTATRRDFRRAVLETLRDLTGSDDEFREEARALLGAAVE